MEYKEERMLRICKELGIEVVDKTEHPDFFKEERSLRLSELYQEPILVSSSEAGKEMLIYNQEIFLEEYNLDAKEKDLSKNFNTVNIEDKIILHREGIKTKNLSTEKAVLNEYAYYIA